MEAELEMNRDSTDYWRFVIMFSKFFILAIDGGLSKSLGVLVPLMVERFNSNYKTVGFVCTLPATLWNLFAPLAYVVVKLMHPTAAAILGGLLAAVPLMCVPLASNLIIFGALMVLSGIGMSVVYLTSFITIYEYFPKSFVFVNAVTFYGLCAGALCLPLLTEKSLEAYGYDGAFLILGGIALHAVVCGAVIRPPRDYQTNVCPSATKVAKDQSNDSFKRDSIYETTWSMFSLFALSRHERCTSPALVDWLDR
ncbi:monocarboxylate transporter 6-like [Diadema setosum]|uniref:monocarboxylate transporter 6-like n=1 Tax=Diadema setosum TaxID=31175 RepID=UPI003B3BD24A